MTKELKKFIKDALDMISDYRKNKKKDKNET